MKKKIKKKIKPHNNSFGKYKIQNYKKFIKNLNKKK